MPAMFSTAIKSSRDLSCADRSSGDRSIFDATFTDNSRVALKVQDLQFTYSGRTIPSILSINFHIQCGEFVVITGKSGSGKSTLLRCLAGLAPHLSAGRFAGQLEVMGRDIHSISIRDLGYLVPVVLQNPETQLCAATVFDEVAFGLKRRQLDRGELAPRVMEALAMVGLEHLSQEGVYRLSGGQQQRLAIASMLAARPPILLLDEPISQLDPNGIAEVVSTLVRLRTELGMTLVVVEHRLEPFVSHLSRLLVMDQGRIVLDESAGSAFQDLSWLQLHGVELPFFPRLFAELGSEQRPRSIEEALPALRLQLKAAPNDVPTGQADSSLMEERPVVLEVRSLSYTYEKKQRRTLEQLSFTAQKGDRIAVIGANGSGKSTLLKCLAGALSVPAGTIWLDGKHLELPHPAIAYVPQNPDVLLISPSIAEELRFGLRCRKWVVEEQERRVRETLRALELEGNSHDAPLAMSRGQRLRVAMAAVMVVQPRVLLLDEPTTGQDRHHLEGLWRALEQVRSLELVIFSTHDVDFALRVATEVLVLDEGKRRYLGKPVGAVDAAFRAGISGIETLPSQLLRQHLGCRGLLFEAIVEEFHAFFCRE